MMGAHHAGTGAAAWVAATAAIPAVPALALVPIPPIAVAVGGLIAAGAALLPDADHPNATIAYSLPGGKALTGAIGAASGGHRHGTHSALVAVAVIAAAFASGWFANLPAYGLVCAVLAAVTFSFGLKVLKIVRGWPVSWLTGIGLAVLIHSTAPWLWAYVPAAIAVGWVTHLAGDFLTTGGLPLTWPWKARPPRSWQNIPLLNRIWTPGGYFALPILGNTGSFRELLLATPLTLYGLYGIAVSALHALPFIAAG